MHIKNKMVASLTMSFECLSLPFDQVDFKDPIFDSIKFDYPGFESWVSYALKTSSSRTAFIVQGPSSYSGVALLKFGEGPDGPSPKGLKISTFKVVREAEAQGIADILLSRILQKAMELDVEVLFITLLPNHEDLVRYLELRGFRRSAQDLRGGERIYVAEMANPERFYSALNRLAYDLLADEYSVRAEAPGPTQESPEYLAGLLLSRIHNPIHRLLELGPGSGSVLSSLGNAADDVVAVEISPRMARLAHRHAPDALIIIADALDVDFPEHSFDGVYAGAFLHLFPMAEAEKMVQRIVRWTKPGGVVFVNTSVSTRSGESIEIKEDYVPRVARFRSKWTEEEFRQLLEHNGLRILDRVTTDEYDRNKFWVAFLCTPNDIGAGVAT
jgi:ubiquinone/menaquinone biosynthesis C-methylase UbiE